MKAKIETRIIYFSLFLFLCGQLSNGEEEKDSFVIGFEGISKSETVPSAETETGSGVESANEVTESETEAPETNEIDLSPDAEKGSSDISNATGTDYEAKAKEMEEKYARVMELVQNLEIDHEGYDNRISQLVAANMNLVARLIALESRLRSAEALLISVHNDQRFHHPTMEVQYVDMQVVQWEEALKSRLRSLAIPFQAGFSIGAVSSWEFSLGAENEAVTVNLLLIEEKYNKGLLFAGFTAYVLDADGNVFSQANALPVNFLDGNGRNLHLPNVIALSEIRNSSNGLLSDGDVFKIRLRLELIGVGHKLYPDLPVAPQPPAKDMQTVVFDVDNIYAKLAKQNERNNNDSAEITDKPLAFTKFVLKHDVWDMETEWSAELRNGENPGKDLSLHIILERCMWPELYASVNVEIWDFLNKRLILTQGTPINDFVKDRIHIDPVVVLSQLRGGLYEDDEDYSLRFKMQVLVYGRHARYYSDVQ